MPSGTNDCSINGVVQKPVEYGNPCLGSLHDNESYLRTNQPFNLTEVPACVICALTMDRLGRKPLMVGAMSFLGVFCVAAGFIPEGDFRTLFMLFGKFGASAGFSIVYQFTAELYPSEIRGTGMGMCSMFGRVGGIAAPQAGF